VPDVRVLASDIEPVAVRMAEANRVANGVDRRFRAILADGLGDARFAAAGPYDLVLANILPDPLTRLAGPVVRLMAPGAALVIAGLRIGEAPRLIAAYRARGLVLAGRMSVKEWSALIFLAAPQPRTAGPRPLARA
jgi:ribosomal protein L11 methyltransferase